jgi:hypothetical protein
MDCSRADGEDRIQAIMSETFTGIDFNPLYGEMAA